jgi:ABC-2 type transport system permease protein
MYRIIAITSKDLLQLVRDGKIYLFLLIMPIAFTLLFGYAFGGFSEGENDPRLPVALLDQDQSEISVELSRLLAGSAVLRLEEMADKTLNELEETLQDGDIAGILIIPGEFGQRLLTTEPKAVTLLAEPSSQATTSLQTEVMVLTRRLASAAWTAQIANQVMGTDFEDSLQDAIKAWENPPVQVETTLGQAPGDEPPPSVGSLAHSSPGMMLQFAIAGLLTAATIIVVERKSRALARLLTTPTSRYQILCGHFLAIFILVFLQFIILITFGQLLLKVNYFRDPIATLMIALSAALCISAMGLLIGVLAKNEGQAIIFSLIPMFILAGIGGAWVPLEVTGETFSTIGHFSPVAWAMDGFKNITIRGLGVEAALIPMLALLGYAALFLIISAWLFNRAEG